MDKTVFLYISAGIILITTFIGSFLPIFIKAKKWTSRLETMAGGVFLGAGLAHLLADSFEELDEVNNLDYPLGPAVALAMFVLLTIVELFSYSEHDAHVFEGCDHHHDHGHEHDHKNENLDNKYLLESHYNENPQNAEGYQPIDNEDNRNQLFGNSWRNLTLATVSLYLIMDIHSFIEGLALGILDDWSKIIAILCAIVGHKPVEAFALSLIIFKDKPTKVIFWIMVFFYVIMSPCAIMVGITLKEFESPLLLGIIAGISAGTFIFVGCHEWSEMFEHKHSWPVSEKLWHLGLFTFGVLWMLLIAIVEELGE